MAGSTWAAADRPSLLRARPNLRAVQELLGHEFVTTTQRYTHLEVEDLQAQVVGPPGNGWPA